MTPPEPSPAGKTAPNTEPAAAAPLTGAARGTAHAVRPTRLGFGARFLAAGVSGGSLALLIVAATLRADPAGHGTHRQLGLPPCGWVVMYGKPCPSCGMTTAFAHAASGNLWESVQAQPFAGVLALGCACAVWVGGHAAATGSRAVTALAPLLRPRTAVLAGTLWGAAWLYKVLTWPGAP